MRKIYFLHLFVRLIKLHINLPKLGNKPLEGNWLICHPSGGFASLGRADKPVSLSSLFPAREVNNIILLTSGK